MLPHGWSFHTASELLFGLGVVESLGEKIARTGARRALVVTDRHLIEAGVCEPVHASLGMAGLHVDMYDGGQAEPAIALVDECVAKARAVRPDVLVAVGGGSNMDLAKAAAVLLAHGGNTRDYVGDDRVPGQGMPVACVPTTSGTGSEVSASAVLTDTDNAVKTGMLSNHIRPRWAVVDPKLTLSCPRKVTADSGIDALTHAIEAYTAVELADFPLPHGERTVYQGRNPMADLFAEKAIELAGRHLVRAVEEPTDLVAREGMSLAATLGGLAFSNSGVALVHALEYPVGGATHCSHGEGNGLLLPFVMRYNLPARRAKFARVAALLGADVAGLSETAAAERAIARVEEIRQRIGIRPRLRDLGAKREQLPTFAEKALAIHRIVRVNPRVPTLADLVGILEEAF